MSYDPRLVLDVIKEEGVDAYKKFMREIIEDGRRGFVNQVKTMLIPGKYRQASFVDVPFKDLDLPSFAKLNTIIHTPSEITVHKDAKFEIDFEGANVGAGIRLMRHPFRLRVEFGSCFRKRLSQMTGLMMVPIMLVNLGFHSGSWFNPDDIRSAHSNTWHALVAAWSPLWRGLSRSYFGRGYLEEVNAGNAHTSNWLMGGGYDQYGQLSAMNSFETSAAELGQVQFKMELAIPLLFGIQREIWGIWKFGSYLNHSSSLEDKFYLGQVDLVNIAVEMAGNRFG